MGPTVARREDPKLCLWSRLPLLRLGERGTRTGEPQRVTRILTREFLGLRFWLRHRHTAMEANGRHSPSIIHVARFRGQTSFSCVLTQWVYRSYSSRPRPRRGRSPTEGGATSSGSPSHVPANQSAHARTPQPSLNLHSAYWSH